MNSAITQKANEITTTVTTLENKVNNMQVGGRNLLLNSKTLSGKTGTNIDNDGFSEGYTTGNGTWNEKQYWWSVNATDNPLTGKQVCISLDFKTDDITKINKMAFSIGTYASNKTTRRGDYNLYVTSYKTIDGSDLENNKWTRIYCVATIPSSFTHSDARYYALQTKIAYDAGTPTMYYKKIKIELGNKPTDWSPAPEDIDSNLTTNYYTKTETETKINQKADEISSTVSSVSTKLNNLQIGGTNLLRGTNIVTSLGSSSAWSNGTWRNAGAGTGTRTSISVSDAPNTNIKVGWSTTSTSGQVLISQDNVKTTSGETYTLSCYAKGTGSILLQYGNGTVGYTGSNIQITDANNWKKYVYTFTSRGTANIYLGSNAAGNNVSFCGMKLEKGNMATDWSPAPEDIAANYYTKSETNSQITQKANEISSVISQRISAVQVGGTNLAKNSAPYSLSYWVNFDTTISLVDESSAPFTKAIKVHYADTSGIGTFNSLERRLEIGKEYSWSVYIKASENTELTVGQEQGGTKIVNLTTSWQKFTHTFTADNGQYKNFVFYCYSDAKQNGLDVYIHSLKLEEGNKSTSWSVNPNDEVTEYNVISKINQTAEAVQIDANKISLVGKQINLTGDNTTITSNNFNVNKYGKVTCSDINITSGTISLSGSQGNPDFSCENNDYSNYVTPDGIYINKKEDVSNKHAYVYVDSDGAGITLGGSVANAITMKAGPSPKITCYGNMYSNSYNYNSKEEIKKNITKYKDNALEIIKNGELYEFNYKQEDKNDKKHIGFIIGNKYKTPKEIISQNSEGIDSYTMTSILWKAIQEQQIIIESLIVRMEQLENKLES